MVEIFREIFSNLFLTLKLQNDGRSKEYELEITVKGKDVEIFYVSRIEPAGEENSWQVTDEAGKVIASKIYGGRNEDFRTVSTLNPKVKEIVVAMNNQAIHIIDAFPEL